MGIKLSGKNMPIRRENSWDTMRTLFSDEKVFDLGVYNGQDDRIWAVNSMGEVEKSSKESFHEKVMV